MLPNSYGLILKRVKRAVTAMYHFSLISKLPFRFFQTPPPEMKEEEEQSRRKHTGEVESSNRNVFLLRINGH